MIEDLMSLNFSTGNIFWIKKNGKKILLSNEGDWINKSFLQKLKVFDKEVEVESKLDKEYCQAGFELLDKFKTTSDENKKAELRIEFINWFKKGYWEAETKGIINLVHICEQVFYSFKVEDEENVLSKLNQDFLVRASVQSSLLISMAIIFGYTNFTLLKELYSAPFLFNLSLDESILSSKMYLSLKARNAGVEDKQVLSDEENRIMSLYPLKSYDKAKDLFGEKLKNKRVLNLIKTQNEKIDGKGGPHKLHERELDDLEMIVAFLNFAVPHDLRSFYASYEDNFFRNKVESSETIFISKRIKSVLVSELNGLDKNSNNYFKISGL